MASASGSVAQSAGNPVVQEYIVRVPKANKKNFHVMGFASSVDVNKWTQVRMERENNMKEFRAEEDLPKFGAGSEFGRDAKEEARRKKFGYISKHYNPEDQPWILQIDGKGGKKYKGIRGGGVTENASYYVFMQAPDGAFEAFPVHEWYNFKPVPRYKALSAEEAEEEFGRRDKVVNFFTIMLKKRLKLEEDDPIDGEEKPQKGKKKKNKKDAKSEFKLTDMDDWPSDSDENSGDEDDDEKGGSDDEKKKQKGKAKGDQGKGKKKPKKKKKEKGSDEEAMEESDEGDFDDREVDYMSDTSSSEGEPEDKANREMKGVEDEENLMKLNRSDDDEEEEQDEKKTNNAEEKDKKGTEEETAAATAAGGKGAAPAATAEDKTKADPKAKGKADKKGAVSSGESSAESSDSDFDDSKFQSAMFMQKSLKGKGGSDNSGNNSRANTPTKLSGDGNPKSKRKQTQDGSGACSPSKKAKHDKSGSNSSSSSSDGISEDAVRRYLMRKPMTTTELLQKFRSKKTGLSGNQLVNTIAQILKRLNPQKQTIKGKLYLSIKQ